MDSTDVDIILEYHTALVESSMFDKAKALEESENFVNNTNQAQKLIFLHYYYYHKKDQKNQEKILEDSLMANQYSSKGLTYAQSGDLDNLKQIMDRLGSVDKALVFAVLKQRDSMYYYLNREDVDFRAARLPNSRPELDPYRKEPRYIEFLKKNYLPIIEKYNGKVE